ncbi:MAG: substrate-binding domain-containing protein, partial [Planctomycetota bacterium]
KNLIIKMATTTSTQDSGLLDFLHPVFEKKTGYKIHVIAVGSGKAIKHGENGDVDVLLTHAPEAEDKFMKEGYGINRHAVMHNDFVILGGEDDPASIKGETDAVEALKKIAASKMRFVSRGDDSGTHKKEIQLWKIAGMETSGPWYVEAGQGMGAVLTMVDQLRAYTIADRGTYLAMRKNLSLKVLCEGDERLLNKYSIIAVNPAKHTHVKSKGVAELIKWYTSEKVKELIKSFKVDGEQLFFPDMEK